MVAVSVLEIVVVGQAENYRKDNHHACLSSYFHEVTGGFSQIGGRRGYTKIRKKSYKAAQRPRIGNTMF